MNRVYLDYNATTPVELEVLDAMLPYFSGEFGNAASIHTGPAGPRRRRNRSQTSGRAHRGRAQEIVFTSGGTESDNHAIFGVVGQAYLPVSSSNATLFPTSSPPPSNTKQS